MSIELTGRRIRLGPNATYAIVIFCGLSALVVAAGARMTPGLIMVPVEKQFGWSRADLSFALAVNLLTFGVAGPLAGVAISVYGIRKVISTGLCLIAAGALLNTWMQHTWQFVLLWGGLVGAGCGIVGPVMASALAACWFKARQGLIVGVFSTSNALAALTILPLLAAKIESKSWLHVSVIDGFFALTALLLIFLLLPGSPQEVGKSRYGESFDDQEIHTEVTLGGMFASLAAAVRNPTFWLLSGSFYVCGLTTNGLIGSHLVAFCSDHGIAALVAAGLLSIMGIFDLVGTALTGWLTDRVNPWAILALLYLLRAICLEVLPFVDIDVLNLTYFMVIYGLNYVATVPPTVRLTNLHFGETAGPMLFGWIMVAHQLGAATAAFGAGLIRSDYGDYAPAFRISGLLALGAALAMLAGRRLAAAHVHGHED